MGYERDLYGGKRICYIHFDRYGTLNHERGVRVMGSEENSVVESHKLIIKSH